MNFGSEGLVIVEVVAELRNSRGVGARDGKFDFVIGQEGCKRKRSEKEQRGAAGNGNFLKGISAIPFGGL